MKTFEQTFNSWNLDQKVEWILGPNICNLTNNARSIIVDLKEENQKLKAEVIGYKASLERANFKMCEKDARIKELECDKAYLENDKQVCAQCLRLKDLEAENARLKVTIYKMENVDENREYAYEMDIVIRWLSNNEDFVCEPNGKMQLLKSKAMHQKIKWLDEHPRVPTTEESSATEKENG